MACQFGFFDFLFPITLFSLSLSVVHSLSRIRCFCYCQFLFLLCEEPGARIDDLCDWSIRITHTTAHRPVRPYTRSQIHHKRAHKHEFDTLCARTHTHTHERRMNERNERRTEKRRRWQRKRKKEKKKGKNVQVHYPWLNYDISDSTGGRSAKDIVPRFASRISDRAPHPSFAHTHVRSHTHTLVRNPSHAATPICRCSSRRCCRRCSGCYCPFTWTQSARRQFLPPPLCRRRCVSVYKI